MKVVFLFLFLALCHPAVFSQINPEKVAEKYQPKNHTTAHPPIVTNLWGIKNVVIVFYQTPVYHQYKETTYEHNKVTGYLLIPEGNQYKKVQIDVYEDDNVDTEILSVFFANADNDEAKELIVLTSNVHRLQYLYEGTEYGVYFYDDFSSDKIPTELKPIYRKNLERFQDNFEGFKAEEHWKSKFKTADDVKKELKRMGYR